MNVLAIESSGQAGSVALWAAADETPVVHWLHGPRRHTADLLPVIEAALAAGGLTLPEIDLLAWSAGPGSFTGLRVGATVVRTLGDALDCPVASVPTLDVLAHNVLDANPPLDGDAPALVVLQDALRGEAFAGVYRRTATGLVCDRSAEVVRPEALLADLPRGVAALGTGCARCGDVLGAAGALVLPEETWIASAGWVARLGRSMAEQGTTTLASAVQPLYLRRPACEDVYEQRRAEAVARRERRKAGG